MGNHRKEKVILLNIREKDVLREMMREQFLQTRGRLRLTQSEMAERLGISERSYSALDRGEYLCGTMTLLRFMIYCHNDPIQLLDKCRKEIEKKEEKQ